jgi:hypothetical protein
MLLEIELIMRSSLSHVPLMSLWSFLKFVYAKLLTKELKTLDKMQLNFMESDFVMHRINNNHTGQLCN